jgi:hypothetical protein
MGPLLGACVVHLAGSHDGLVLVKVSSFEDGPQVFAVCLKGTFRVTIAGEGLDGGDAAARRGDEAGAVGCAGGSSLLGSGAFVCGGAGGLLRFDLYRRLPNLLLGRLGVSGDVVSGLSYGCGLNDEVPFWRIHASVCDPRLDR